MDVSVLSCYNQDAGEHIVGVYMSDDHARESIPYWKLMASQWWDGETKFFVNNWVVKNGADFDGHGPLKKKQ